MSDIILECRNLSKSFGSKSALSDVKLSLRRGRIVGLLGPNGSGKTTLLKLANGLLQPTSGELYIDGIAPGVETKGLVSYLPDRSCLAEWMSVSELTNMFAEFYADFRRDVANSMLRQLSIDPSARFKTLSKGTKEKIQLILAMSRAASLYLLDEPIGGVDPATRDYIINSIITNYSENSTVIISTHLIGDVENILDDIIFLKEGKLMLYGSADEIREQHGKSIDSLFREVFRC